MSFATELATSAVVFGLVVLLPLGLYHLFRWRRWSFAVYAATILSLLLATLVTGYSLCFHYRLFGNISVPFVVFWIGMAFGLGLVLRSQGVTREDLDRMEPPWAKRLDRVLIWVSAALTALAILIVAGFLIASFVISRR